MATRMPPELDSTAKPDVHRTTVDIEVDAFEEARALLGTTGYRDTVTSRCAKSSGSTSSGNWRDMIQKGELREPEA